MASGRTSCNPETSRYAQTRCRASSNRPASRYAKAVGPVPGDGEAPRQIQWHFPAGPRMAPHQLTQPGPVTLDERVFGRDERLCRTGIALPGTAADQLAVHAGVNRGIRRQSRAVRRGRTTSGASRISVPRPARLVAIVIARCPARATTGRFRGVLPSVQQRELQPSPAKHVRQTSLSSMLPGPDQHRPPADVHLRRRFRQSLPTWPAGWRKTATAGLSPSTATAAESASTGLSPYT